MQHCQQVLDVRGRVRGCRDLSVNHPHRRPQRIFSSPSKYFAAAVDIVSTQRLRRFPRADLRQSVYNTYYYTCVARCHIVRRLGELRGKAPAHHESKALVNRDCSALPVSIMYNASRLASPSPRRPVRRCQSVRDTRNLDLVGILIVAGKIRFQSALGRTRASTSHALSHMQ